MKPTYRKSCALNLLIWSDLTLISFKETDLGWKSSDMFRFDIGPLLQSQTRIVKLKSAYNLLIIDPRGFQCETNL